MQNTNTYLIFLEKNSARIGLNLDKQLAVMFVYFTDVEWWSNALIAVWSLSWYFCRVQRGRLINSPTPFHHMQQILAPGYGSFYTRYEINYTTDNGSHHPYRLEHIPPYSVFIARQIEGLPLYGSGVLTNTGLRFGERWVANFEFLLHQMSMSSSYNNIWNNKYIFVYNNWIRNEWQHDCRVIKWLPLFITQRGCLSIYPV